MYFPLCAILPMVSVKASVCMTSKRHYLAYSYLSDFILLKCKRCHCIYNKNNNVTDLVCSKRAPFAPNTVSTICYKVSISLPWTCQPSLISWTKRRGWGWQKGAWPVRNIGHFYRYSSQYMWCTRICMCFVLKMYYADCFLHFWCASSNPLETWMTVVSFRYKWGSHSLLSRF